MVKRSIWVGIIASTCLVRPMWAGAEFPICEASYGQGNPAASSASGYTLIVWEDLRDSSTSGVDIRGVILDQNGSVIDPPGELVICNKPGEQSHPNVATDGSSFLVVWQDARNSGTTGFDIYAAIVSSSGVVSPAGGFAVAALASDQKYPDVAWMGSSYVVAWEHNESGDWNIHAARVSASGELLDSNPIVVDSTTSKQDSVCAAGGPGRALLAYRDSAGGTHIKGAIVEADGSVAKLFTIANAPLTQKSPRAAVGGPVWLVVWEDWRDSPDPQKLPDIYAARVEVSTGNVLDNAPHIEICKGAYASYSPAAAFDGWSFVVAWTDNSNASTNGFDVYYKRVRPSGQVRDETPMPVIAAEQDQQAVALTRAGDGVLAVWSDSRGGAPPDIRGRFLDTNDPPVAVIKAPAGAAEGEPVTLDGSGAFDPEGAALEYEWTQLDGPPCTLDDATSPTPVFMAPEALASYTVKFSLRVNDGLNWSAPAEIDFTVSADDDPPVAIASAPANATEGDTITLDGSGSFDPEGMPLSYSWRQLAGPAIAQGSLSGQSPSFVAPEWLAPYKLEFELVVSDGVNPSAPAKFSIDVDADDDPPVALAGDDYSVLSSSEAWLDGSGSSDPEGRPLSYSWSQIAGPPVALSGTYKPLAQFTAPSVEADTSLLFRLSVSDGVHISSDEIEVHVLPSGANTTPVAYNIEAIAYASGDASEAQISWSTDPVPATGLVRYGTTPALGLESAEETSFSTQHAVTLPGLRFGATYWFVVRSKNLSGAWSLSEPSTFQTPPPPQSVDADGDGIPDAWELAWDLTESAGDPDGDGLTNLDEYCHGTNPKLADTDGDGFSDGYEVLRGTDPLRSDSVPPPWTSGRSSPSCGQPVCAGAIAWAAAAIGMAGLRRIRTKPSRP